MPPGRRSPPPPPPPPRTGGQSRGSNRRTSPPAQQRTANQVGNNVSKFFDPRIVEELRTRSISGNFVETLFPFVRLTAAVELGSDIGFKTNGRINKSGKYFSIGLHSTQDHLTNTSGSALGSTVSPGFNQMGQSRNREITNYNNPFSGIYNVLEDTDSGFGPLIGTILSPGPNGGYVSKYVRAAHDVTTGEKAATALTAPPPGVTNVKIDRISQGYVSTATVEIVVPTLTQFEALCDIFFLPGVTMILEWGSLSSTEARKINLTETENRNELVTLPWHDLTKIEQIIMGPNRNGYGPSMQQVFAEYTHPSYGRYSFFVGKVASFEAKAQPNGEFTATIKIVGVGDQNFGYDVTQTASTVKPTDAPPAASDANRGGGSIVAYFQDGGVFDNLVTRPNTTLGEDWVKHIVKISRTANVGDVGPTDSATESVKGQEEARREQANNPSFNGQSLYPNEDAVFISWKFFVNIVVNSQEFGIKKFFRDAGMTPDQIRQIKLLNPLSAGPNDPDEPYVGCNKYLRSTDPTVCVIYNEVAESAIRNGNTPWKVAMGEGYLGDQGEEKLNPFTKLGSIADSPDADVGFLSRGVWLNASFVKRIMQTATDFHTGIRTILNQLSAAVGNYWQLDLQFEDTATRFGTNVPIQDWIVIDKKLRRISPGDKAKPIYVFNRFFDPTTGVGSELLECSVGLDSNPALTTQFAFGNPAQSSNQPGVTLGTFDASMQNVFQPASDGGLKLLDIDIVRRRLLNVTPPRPGGATNRGAGEAGGSSVSQGSVTDNQQNNPTNLPATNIPGSQLTYEQKEAKITELNNRIAEINKIITCSPDIDSDCQEVSNEQREELQATGTALLKERQELEASVTPVRKAKLLTNRFPHLRSIFTFIEFDPDLMRRCMLEVDTHINEREQTRKSINNNLLYTLTPLEAELVLPGIAGLYIGSLCRIARLPRRMFSLGAWQIMSINETIETSGWTTSIKCRFFPIQPEIVKTFKEV